MSVDSARLVHRLVAASAAPLALAVAACTLLRPLDYLTGGADGASAADAMDGAITADEGSEGTETAPQGTWCMQQQPSAFFCADFDEALLTSVYTSGSLVTIQGPVVGPGGDASIGSSMASSPGDFLAFAPATPDGGTLAVRYEEPVSVPSASKGRLRLDMQLLSLTVGEEVDVASLYLYAPDGGTPARLFLSIQPSGAGTFFLDTGTTTEGQPFSFPADGKWHTYEIEIDLNPTLRASLYLDLKPTPTAAVTDLTVPFTVAQPTSFYLGISVLGPSSQVQVAYDNVVLTAQ